MTSPKHADHPECRLSLSPMKDGRVFVDVDWIDSGRERIAARITKALKWGGHEVYAARVSCFSGEVFRHSPVVDNTSGEDGDHRHCGVRTSAPLEVVEKIVSNYFLVIKVDRTIPSDDAQLLGTALDLIDLDLTK